MRTGLLGDMRVVEVAELNGASGVRLADRPEPEAGDDVVVEVRAGSLSFPDLLRAQGRYQDVIDVPYVLGQEFAGMVVAAPADSPVQPGERVAGVTEGTGAFAERLAIAHTSLIRLSTEMDYETGACAIFNYQTAIVALIERGRLKAGETVLIHGASGGTGTAAVQVAISAGARPLAVVSTEAKIHTARLAGVADDDVILADARWRDAVIERTGGAGVNVAFDPVGGDRMLDTIRVLAHGGRWVIVGFAAGEVPQIPANRVLFRNIDVVGSYLAGYLRNSPVARQGLQDRLRSMIADGAIHPIVGSVFPAAEAGAALREIAERRVRGNAVISW